MHISKLSRAGRTLVQILLVVIVTFVSVMLILVLLVLVPPNMTSSANTSSYTYEQVVSQDNVSITQSWCLNQNPQHVYN